MDRRPSFRLLLPVALLILVAASIVPILVHAAHAHTDELAATYTGGRLSVTIPYHSDRAGAGRLVAEILDPEDHVLGHVEHAVDIAKGDGSWQQTISPGKAIPFADIVWQRLRYRIEYVGNQSPAIEGIEPISQILRRPVVRILGQTAYLTGSRAAVRIIVSDANNDDVNNDGANNSAPPGTIQTGSVRVELIVPNAAANQAPRQLFSGRLNHRGTVEAQFRFPSGLTGKFNLHYVADTAIGSAEYTQQIELNDKASILLTTEKPIYQPGQTIHVRALALDRADMKASDARELTFELEDARGNKVFRKITATDSFGIASAEFSLADEVNLGTYHLRALMEESDAPSNTAEISLSVERYVLPKFKVAVEFTAANGKPKRDYRPGDHVTGTVRANYFFGKPVDHAEITLKASSADVAVFEAASATGTTDAEGAYKFDLKLPTYFAGKPLTQGAARALVEASVKDSADHTETRGEPITITESPLLLTAVPEGGTLIPHIENQVFILSAYPDGSPASSTLTVHLPGTHAEQVTTDSGGVAVVRFTPGTTVGSLRIDADDHHGNRATSDVSLETRTGEDQVLLRTDRAILKGGDPIHLKVLSTRSRGSAYIDIVKNGQTILTRDLDLQNGQAELTLNATPEMAGTLDIDAYLFGRDAQPVADHRLVFVQPADELRIETSADASVYKPNSDARIRFHVTNSRGEGVFAALGVQAVDEAVFALAEKHPGFAKVFFYLEQEVMKPRYEIHSLSMPDTITNGTQGAGTHRPEPDLAARALFSATEMTNPTKLDTEFGRTLPQDTYAVYAQRYRDAFTVQVTQFAATLTRELEQRPSGQDLARVFQNPSPPRDAWGTPVRMEPVNRSRNGGNYYLVRSAGPDRQFNSADDLTVYVEERAGAIASSSADQARHGGTVDLKIEHDRGAFNRHAEVFGTVADSTGAVIPGATITLRPVSTRDIHFAHSSNSGQFTLSGLAPGIYEVRVSEQGFEVASREFTLQERDRAVLSATLTIGSTTQTVMVSAPPPVRVFRNFAPARSMGGVMAAKAAPASGLQMNFAIDAVTVEVQASGVALPLPVMGRSFETRRKEAEPAAPHVRSYFPEALYINPEILTDGHGDASISIPIADSITTWRLATIASTRSGSLGTGTSSLKVFQDFFVDLDLPVTLTQGDRVSIPVGVYNYSGGPGKVSLKLAPESWFSLNNDTGGKLLEVEAGRVGAAQFTINANRIGKFKLTLSAHMEGAEDRESKGHDDIVVREIEVIPNGREQDLVFNGRLDTTAQHNLAFPPNSISDATSVFVRLYPGPLSQVIEGMDSILRMPGGCFEQTSSSTYPNVLALDYMKRAKKLTPEVHAKAEGYIANGYQRLLTFEVSGGGFSWFGQAPANKILTAYGLMEFNDMAKVSDVDPRLIARTSDWLARQQQPDGSWKPDTNFINEGATNRYNTDVLRITAYIAWSLANTGYRGPAVENAKRYIASHADNKPDTYTLAVIANFAADYKKDKDFTRHSMQALLDARTEKDEQALWSAEDTGVYSTGPSAAIETTGLAAQALLKWGEASEVVRKSLTFLSSKKQASGNWGTTQATIMALRALLLASQLNSSDVHGTVAVTLNGKLVESLNLTSENNDLLHQFVFKNIDANQTNSVQLKFSGTGGLVYQVVGRYFTPYEEKPVHEALAIAVDYDRTKLAQNDIATAKVTIHNNLDTTANMVMVDLGIPPGFDLLSEDLQSLEEKSDATRPGHLEKFTLTAKQAILYFNALAPAQTVTMNVRLRAKYPIRARTFQSRAYEYYSPEISAIAKPVQLEINAN